MQDIARRLDTFVGQHRDELSDDKEVTYFELIFGDVHRYIVSLNIVIERTRASSREYVRLSRSAHDLARSHGEGTRPLTAEEAEGYAMVRSAQQVLHLDLESMFLFGSILLDRVAAATEFYFGSARKPWKSFRAMRMFFESYASNRGLTDVPEVLIVEVQWLFEHVSEIRHLLVVHKHETDDQLRLSIGTSFIMNGSDEDATFGIGIFYPKDEDKHIETAKTSDISHHFEVFLSQWINYLRSEAGHSVLARR